MKRSDRVRFAELRPDEIVDLGAMPRTLGRLLRLAWAHPVTMAYAVTGALGAALISLLIPRVLGAAVDRAHGLVGQGLSFDTVAGRLSSGAALLLGLSVLRGLLRMLGGYQGEVLGQQVGFRIRLDFFEQLQRLGFDFHDRIHSGDLITRGMLDVEGVRAFVSDGLQRLLLVVMLLSVGAVRLFSTDAVMALLALSFVPIVAWQGARTGVFVRVTWTRLQEQMALLTRVMEESLQGLRVVRAFAAARFELAKFDGVAQNAMRIARFRIRLRALAMTEMQTVFYLAMALVLAFGGARVGAGRISVGQLTEILAFMTIVQQPVRQIFQVVSTAARATASGQRLFEVLDRRPIISNRAAARALPTTPGVLRFEHVDFAHMGGEAVLEDLSFEVAPGQTLGIVGAPGSGKSSIAHLIPRFYDVTGGRITLHGIDVRDLTLESLRASVALVAQDLFLFDIQAGENIAYADPHAELERIVSAAHSARIHEHVSSMPLAYATLIGERGVSLSGGQRQRLSIARGALTQARVMILDDSLSAVDTATEAALRSELWATRSGRATLIIAHRLSSLIGADEIIVLDRGRILERGTHARLMELDGQYAKLYRLQSAHVASGSGLMPA